MALHERTPAPGKGGRGSGKALRDSELTGKYVPPTRAASGEALRARIADFITAYRLAHGEPSQMQAAVLAAFAGATAGDYALALMAANRAARSREVALG